MYVQDKYLEQIYNKLPSLLIMRLLGIYGHSFNLSFHARFDKHKIMHVGLIKILHGINQSELRFN